MASLNLWERLRVALRAHLQVRRDAVDALRSATSVQQAALEELRAIRTTLAAMRGDPRRTAYDRQIDSVIAADGRYSDPRCLARYSASIYSQLGEDGIIAEIFARIGPKDRTFVEIGVEDGRENTTRFLLEMGWRGTWLEASEEQAAKARTLMRDRLDSGQLTIVPAAVTAENVNDLLDSAGVPASFDYLSIDIDQNTPYVWEALRRRSRVACIEYNGHLPPTLPIRVRYDPTRYWDGSMWFGGSLKAMERIGGRKRMALVGCDMLGINAFFVTAEETAGRFREPFNAETHFQRPRFDILAPPRLMPDDAQREWQVEE